MLFKEPILQLHLQVLVIIYHCVWNVLMGEPAKHHLFVVILSLYIYVPAMWICNVLILLFWVRGWLLDLQLTVKHNNDKTLFTLSYSWLKPKVPEYKPIVISSNPHFKFVWLCYQLSETFGHIRGQLKCITSTSRKISTLWKVCSHLCSARSVMSKHSVLSLKKETTLSQMYWGAATDCIGSGWKGQVTLL